MLLKDFTKLIIVCKKINPKHLEDKELTHIKLSYFLLKYHYHVHQKEYRECSECLVKAFEALNA